VYPGIEPVAVAVAVPEQLQLSFVDVAETEIGVMG
jgi:hypothetical protein